VSSAEAKNLEAISKAIDHHNATCEWPAVAVEMNPFEVDRLGWFRIVCAREDGLPAEEETVEAVADQTVPAEMTPAR
jgi:predicted NUDIX family NTP pyrophosphohydrolase